MPNKANKLIVPIYINEKIVIDMLATIEDGFSMVSQVDYIEHKENEITNTGEMGISASVLSRLLKIDVSGELGYAKNKGTSEKKSTEKIHTNVSLLYKFREYLMDNDIIKTDFDISNIFVGDFIEIEGEIQKNPLINYFDLCLELFQLVNAISSNVNSNAKNHGKKGEATSFQGQIKAFADELKQSGTIDFILNADKGTVVLSAQEQYLENDCISEMIGGKFKVLGKVILVCKDEWEEINLLRKTSLSVFSEESLAEMFSGLKSEEMNQFNLPELITKIHGPAIIVIPIAIYA